MLEKLKINFFINYTGDDQESMHFYNNQLLESLSSGFANQCEFTCFVPRENRLDAFIKSFPLGNRINSYWKRFITHPSIARRIGEGVNHITDHNNSYLIQNLDPQRTIVTCHDLVYLRLHGERFTRPSPKYFFRDKVRRHAISGLATAAKVIAVSQNTKRDLEDLLSIPSGRIKVIYSGIGDGFKKVMDNDRVEEAKKKFQISWARTILHVGENSFYKNIEGIIFGLRYLHDKYTKEVHFVKVGRDFTREQKALIRKLVLENYVHYLGKLSQQDLNLVYCLADMMVFPSHYEGFGRPPLEAMACGTPVVCSYKGSLKEVVQDAAIIVEPKDYEGIAGAIYKLLSDPDHKKKKILEGFQNIKRFDWAKTAKEVFQVYTQVWENNHG